MTLPSASADEGAAASAGRWTVAIFALIGLGIGLAVFAFREPVYEAQTLVAVSNPVGTMAQEAAVVTGSTVTNAAASALGFQPEISVSAAEVASLLTITARSNDAQRAANAANTVAATYVQAQLGTAASIAQPAVPADSPTGFSLIIFAAVGSLLGALVGALMANLQRLRPASTQATDQAAPDENDATQPLPVLAPPLQAQSLVPPTSRDEPTVLPPPKPDQQAQPEQQAQPAPQAQKPPAPSTPSTPSMWSDPTPPRVPTSPPPASIDAEPSTPPTETSPAPMDTTPIPPTPAMSPSSFADAAGTENVTFQPETAPAAEPKLDHLTSSNYPTQELQDLDRLAMQKQFEAVRYELDLVHNEQLAHQDTENERVVASMRAEIADLNKQVRMRDVRLNNRSGTDQNRVGDLEAQTDALELELASIRQTLESQRIAHSKQLTEERGLADRALDNARRQYREELAKHVHTHRLALADHRADLDKELAEDRTNQAEKLELQHVEYEVQLENERSRMDTKLAADEARHRQEVIDLRAATRQSLDRQATQHKDTITELRGTGENNDKELRELQKENRALRVELNTQQKQGRHNETESASLAQRLSDEIAIMRSELDGERERNAALRADVLRRSAEAHQVIDRAVEERTAQLSELEASVARQREYADKRVRETSAAAEEQSRQAVVREADLTAQVSRLKRELAEANQSLGREPT